MKVCAVAGCGKTIRAKGLCISHYSKTRPSRTSVSSTRACPACSKTKTLKSWYKGYTCGSCWRKELRKTDPEKLRSAWRRWAKKHPERVQKQKVAYRVRNKMRLRELGRAVYRRHKARFIARAAFRRARQLQATPPWLTSEHKRQMYLLYKNRPEGFHVDHEVPLCGENVSGLHVPWNLRYLPAEENLKKNNKFNGDNRLKQPLSAA